MNIDWPRMIVTMVLIFAVSFGTWAAGDLQSRVSIEARQASSADGCFDRRRGVCIQLDLALQLTRRVIVSPPIGSEQPRATLIGWARLCVVELAL